MALRSHVIKLAQPGFDARTTGDENLIFSSEWPLFPIYKTATVRIPDASKDVVLCEHDLKYPAAFWPITNNTFASWLGAAMAPASRSEFMGFNSQYVGVDDKKLVYYGTRSGSFTGTFDLTYYLFAIDLTKEFVAPTINVGGEPPADAPFVLKIAKDSEDATSEDLSDFVIHSDGRSPMIHSVNPGVANVNLGGAGFAFTAFHNLTYNPLFFMYLEGKNTPSGTYSLFPSGSGGSTVVEADDEIVRYRQGTSGQRVSIIVCKDPFEIKSVNKVKV